MSTVSHYGIHLDGNAVCLHENGGGRYLTPGLETLPSPFTVVGPKLPCPHKLPEPKLVVDLPLDVHPLIEAMGPWGSGKAYHVNGGNQRLLSAMTAMVGPTRPILFAAWAQPIRNLMPELTLTNAAPLVIVDYESRHYADLERLLALPRTRNVILCGSYKVGGIETIGGDGLSPDQDWARTGATLLWRYVMNQQL
jgi:hypothetical protein